MSVNRLLIPLTLITLAGALLRFYRLDSIPAGLHYDIAANAILVEDIAIRGYRPAFISAYTGKEVLFFYSAAALFRLIGSSIFALRATAAFWGVITIPITYFFLRQLLRHQKHSIWLAAFGATMLAFSFAHLPLSRFGLRAITQPAIQALAVGILLRGLRTGRSRDFWIAGLLVGLSMHTYLSARALPLVLLVSGLPLLRARSRTLTIQPLPSAGQMLGFVISISLVIAPLAHHFWEHPEEFFTRIAQVAPDTAEAELLWRGVSSAIGMLFVSGEPYDRFNIPHKPLLGPILGPLFVIGFVIILSRLVRPRGETAVEKPINRMAEWMLLAWIPVFLLPTALAVHEVLPSTMRAFGLFPALFAFPAIGLLSTIKWFSSHHSQSRILLSVSLTTLAALTLAFTARDYFWTWARLRTHHLANDGDLAHVAQFMNTSNLNHSSVYVSAIHHQHPTIAYLAQEYGSIRWLRSARALAVPANGPVLYIFPQSAPAPLEWLSGWESALTASPLDPLGRVDFHAYVFERAEDVPKPEFQHTYANFGHAIELTGFRVVEARSGQHVLADIQLQVLKLPEHDDYRLVADLVDTWGHPWEQSFNESYPSAQWRQGDYIIARVEIPLPTGIPPGRYWLGTTLYSPKHRENLPALDVHGRAAAAALVGPLHLERSAQNNTLPTVENSASAQFGDLELFGYDLPVRTLRPGEELQLLLYWRANKAPSVDYRIRLNLGETTLSSSAPVHGSYSTLKWAAGEVVIDRHNPRLPRSFPYGDSELYLSVDVDGHRLGDFSLGYIKVDEIERQWEAPVAVNPADIALGDIFSLIGYDLEIGQQLTIQLHWESIATTDTDFTVFVHAFNPQGIMSGQSDSQPVSGTYPTSLWKKSEFVTDKHTLALLPGTYSLELGMYLPSTGERLLLHSGEDSIHIPAITVP